MGGSSILAAFFVAPLAFFAQAGTGPPIPLLAATSPADSTDLVIEHLPIDSAAAATIRSDAESGRRKVETFFGSPLGVPVTLRVFPDRAALDDHFRQAFGMERSECWMVGGAESGSLLVLLSPRVWGTEACDHDPHDPLHARHLVAHEIVHVYHMQRYGSADFDEAMGWFVEGLATYVSGQLDGGQRERAVEALEAGALPSRLADGWSGPYRYGVSGSLVEYVDGRWGRGVLYDLLGARTQAAILSELAVDEETLLQGWRDWLAASR